VEGLPVIVDIAADEGHSHALDENGEVWAWGGNIFGELGTGNRDKSLRPKKIVGLRDVVQIHSGTSHCLALDRVGNVWSWGQNVYGQLGIKNIKWTSIPVKVDFPEKAFLIE